MGRGRVDGTTGTQARSRQAPRWHRRGPRLEHPRDQHGQRVPRPNAGAVRLLPLHPEACARIIGDLAIFHVETSAVALERSVRAAGIDARWVRPRGGAQLGPGEVVMNMSVRESGPLPAEVASSLLLDCRDLSVEITRTLQMRRAELDTDRDARSGHLDRRHPLHARRPGAWRTALATGPRRGPGVALSPHLHALPCTPA